MNIPQEFRRGWRVVLASALGVAFGLSPVPYNTIGHIMGPLQAEFGWSRGEISGALTVLAGTVTLCAYFFGRLVDRIGVRKVAIGSLTAFGLSWALIALTPPSLLAFYALFAFCAVVGGASVPISWTRAINAWFVEKRGMALALALCGTGFTAALINFIAPTLVTHFGWRGVMVGTALLPLLIALPVAIKYFHEPETPITTNTPNAQTKAESGEQVGFTTAEALRQPRFWFILIAITLVALAFGGLYVNLVPLLTDKGFSTGAAGGIAGSLGLAVLGGRLAVGYFLDKIWAPWVALPTFLCAAGACLVFTGDNFGFALAMTGAILLGVAAGAETDLIAFLAAKYFGLKNYGAIYGILYMPFAFGTALSAPVYGFTFDYFGSYNLALYTAAGFFTVGALLLFLIGPYPDLDAAHE